MEGVDAEGADMDDVGMVGTSVEEAKAEGADVDDTDKEAGTAEEKSAMRGQGFGTWSGRMVTASVD